MKMFFFEKETLFNIPERPPGIKSKLAKMVQCERNFEKFQNTRVIGLIIC